MKRNTQSVKNAVRAIKNPQSDLKKGDVSPNQGLLFSTILEEE